MKILLTAINAKYIHSNLAVYSLKAYAKQYKEEIQIAEYTINQKTDEILMELYKKKPDVLLFSCYIWNRTYVEELVKEFGKLCPHIPIWLGGPEVSYDASGTLRRLPEVKGIMKGEGEETFLALTRFYHSGKKEEELSKIKGITFRTEDGRIVENEWREILDLSKVPFVYEDMTNFTHKIIYYETSRGCPFSCSYCLSSIDKCLRFRDLKLVKKELQFFLDQNVPQVKFVDRTFNCKHDHAQEIWRYLLEHDNGVTNFHFEVSADLLNEAELQLIERMRPGLIQLEIGVQSTNERTIREIKRTMKFDDVARVVKRIHKNGNVHQHLDLIAGLPYEDYESFGKSFDDVYGLSPEQLQLGFLKVLSGSYMKEHAASYGLLHKSTPPYEVLQTKWLSYEELIRLKGVEEMVEVYYNSGQFTHTLSKMEEEFGRPFAFFEALSDYYEREGLSGVNHGREKRYEILLSFAKIWGGERLERYRELLIYDYYLRENSKKRPEFAGEERVEKSFAKAFYDTEEIERNYLSGYETHDRRSLRKMTHIEKFTYNVIGKLEKKEIYILFDYQNRDKMYGNATIFELMKM